MGAGRGGARGTKASLDFENFSEKGYFLSFNWEKNKFHQFWCRLEKIRKNPLVPLLEKFFRRPCRQLNCWFLLAWGNAHATLTGDV